MEVPTKVRDLEVFEQNPFVDEMHVEKKRRTEVLYNGQHALINQQTGEVSEEGIAIARVRYVDSEQFIKIYTDNIHVFFDLGKSAQRVCEFVLNQISHRSIGRGEVFLIFNEYEKYLSGRTGGTRQTFMRGMQELAQKKMIAKSPSPNVWWINPAVAFNGDRARFITEIRRDKKENELDKTKRNILDYEKNLL